MTSSQQATQRSQTRRQAAEASVHVSVLGMDGTDQEVSLSGINKNQRRAEETTSTSNSRTLQKSSLELGLLPHKPESAGRVKNFALAPTTSPSRSQTKSSGAEYDDSEVRSSTADNSYWWGKVLWGKTAGEDGDDDDASNQYQSLEPPESDGQPQQMRMGITGIGVSPASLLNSSSSYTTTTIEDRIKQDCSFFYQGIKDPASASSKSHLHLMSTTGGGLNPLTTALNHSIPRFMSSREGSRFKTQYERLNQEIHCIESDDLLLDQDQVGRKVVRQNTFSSEVIDFASTANASQNTGKLSTLFFEQDGRLLMKLPRDQIRLIMDQDLEPGIISVEQWRQVDKASFNPVGPSVGEEESKMKILEDGTTIVNKGSQPPPLRYVMTVPEDLYQRVVAEMSYALLPPCWGIFNCCNATEGKADIKLALVILAFILLLMFISTMVWPTN